MRQPVRTFVTRSCCAVDITSTKVGGGGERNKNLHLQGPRCHAVVSEQHSAARGRLLGPFDEVPTKSTWFDGGEAVKKFRITVTLGSNAAA